LVICPFVPSIDSGMAGLMLSVGMGSKYLSTAAAAGMSY